MFSAPSFPRRRESKITLWQGRAHRLSQFEFMDFRLRGNDGLGMTAI